MDDRELLEMAAKAAKLGTTVPCFGVPPFMGLRLVGGALWNPLTDDGDALRLAVKLKLDIEHSNTDVYVALSIPPFHRGVADAGDDRAAATRRAIVRAAAEIGRGVKEG